jgi:hypothetical protein
MPTGRPLGFADCAVLYRTDAQAGALRTAFDRAGCVGVSASSEEAWNPGSESRTGPLDLRVSPDFRAAAHDQSPELRQIVAE